MLVGLGLCVSVLIAIAKDGCTQELCFCSLAIARTADLNKGLDPLISALIRLTGKFATRSELTIALWFTVAARLVRTPPRPSFPWCFCFLGVFLPGNSPWSFLGRTPKGAYSTRGRSRHLLETPFSEPLLETPFSEPLLRTLLRTLFYCKTHRRPPSQNPSENPFPRTLFRTFSEPFSERCVAVRPLRRAPYFWLFSACFTGFWGFARWEKSLACEGFIRHRAPQTPPSNPPRPPQGSIWHRFNIDSTLNRHRNRVKSGNRCQINVESMLNGCQIDP